VERPRRRLLARGRGAGKRHSGGRRGCVSTASAPWLHNRVST
jgi:hypothetical protein